MGEAPAAVPPVERRFGPKGRTASVRAGTFVEAAWRSLTRSCGVFLQHPRRFSLHALSSPPRKPNGSLPAGPAPGKLRRGGVSIRATGAALRSRHGQAPRAAEAKARTGRAGWVHDLAPGGDRDAFGRPWPAVRCRPASHVVERESKPRTRGVGFAAHAETRVSHARRSCLCWLTLAFPIAAFALGGGLEA
jgi:hypothetical protein